MSVVELDVYLGSRLVGSRGEVDQVRFVYDSDWLARGGLDIARMLPVQTEPLPPGPTRAFFDGLLPESSLREVLARDWGVDPLDTWGHWPYRPRVRRRDHRPSRRGVAPTPAKSTGSRGQLAETIRRLPVAPLASDPSSPVRVSLGGVQDKLVLVYDGERWGLPHPGTPSTHIAKPDPRRDWLPTLPSTSTCAPTGWADRPAHREHEPHHRRGPAGAGLRAVRSQVARGPMWSGCTRRISRS